MGNPFQIYGPFDISKPLVAGKGYQSTFWADCDEAHPRLSVAKGVYVFSLRNGSNYSPQYVGMTKRSFAKEVFNPNNLVKILDDFVKSKGTLCLHLLAKPNEANGGFFSPSLKTLLWTEMFVLLLCRKKNPEIVNIMGKPFLDDAGIANITDAGKGKGANIQTFRNVLGFGMATGKQKQKTKQNNQPPVQPSPQPSSPLTSSALLTEL